MDDKLSMQKMPQSFCFENSVNEISRNSTLQNGHYANKIEIYNKEKESNCVIKGNSAFIYNNSNSQCYHW